MRSPVLLIEILLSHEVDLDQIAFELGCQRRLVTSARHGKPISARYVERLEAMVAQLPKKRLDHNDRFVRGGVMRYGR
jgi:hypothetical protein